MDPATGLYDYRSRVYSPELGRFLSPDPLGYPDGPNAYAAFLGNPVNNTDPYGTYVESAWDIASLSIGLASLGHNLWQGNWGAAGFDTLGVVADAAALALPIVPGGAGVAIKAKRAVDAIQAVDQAVNVGQGVVQASEELSQGNVGWGAFYGGMAAFGGVHLSRNQVARDVGRAVGPRLNPLNYEAIPGALGSNLGNVRFRPRQLREAGASAKFVHDEFVRHVLGPNVAEQTFELPWTSGRLGTRRVDHFDDASRTAFEGNTTPWAHMSASKLQHKLKQVADDLTLLEGGDVQRVIWFGTEELPTTGRGGQLREALEQAGIPYWVVK